MVVLLGYTKISCIFVKEITTKTKEIMKNRAKFNRQFTAMTNKAIELGFKNIREAQANGFELELKNAFENEK